MENNVFQAVEKNSKYWWTSLLVGLLGIALGICSLCTPDSTLLALAYVFIFAFFFSGIFDIVNALSNTNVDGWGWMFAGGIIDILFGVLLLALPTSIVTQALIYFVGFWIMFRSIWTIGIAVDLQKYTNATWLIVFSILGLIFSLFYLLSPAFFGGTFIVVLVSIAFISYGIFRIYYAFRLKAVNDEIKDVTKE